jgi:hypothetical protein
MGTRPDIRELVNTARHFSIEKYGPVTSNLNRALNILSSEVGEANEAALEASKNTATHDHHAHLVAELAQVAQLAEQIIERVLESAVGAGIVHEALAEIRKDG